MCLLVSILNPFLFLSVSWLLLLRSLTIRLVRTLSPSLGCAVILEVEYALEHTRQGNSIPYTSGL